MSGTNFRENQRRKNSDIVAILASEGVEFLISCKGKVPLSSLEEKKVCLYFSSNWCRPCQSFTPKLSKLYNELIKTEKNLEIIFVSFDRNEDGFKDHFKGMPWLALPFDLGLQKRLSERYKVVQIPSFIPLNCVNDVDLIEDDCIGLIEDYGEESFPFTKRRKEELMAIDRAKLEGGTLEHLLGNGNQNYLINRGAILPYHRCTTRILPLQSPSATSAPHRLGSLFHGSVRVLRFLSPRWVPRGCEGG